jgi:hypothetical protein
LIKKLRQKEHPGIVPSEVYYELKQTFVSKWQPICAEWFREIEIYGHTFLQWVVNQTFGKFGNSELKREVE